MRPPFIRAVPDEVQRYGPAAALVLAHIRYRCGDSDAPVPGVIEVDGVRWWRVPRRVLADEVGLTLKVVRKALADLDEVVLAKHLPPLDRQDLAYRVRPECDPLNCQKPEGASADLPEAPQGQDRAPQGQVPSPTGPGTEPHRASALSLENLETRDKEGGEARAQAHDPIDAADLPSQLNTSTRQTDPRGNRLPDGWIPDRAVVADMRSNHPHVDLAAEHAKFTDYWQAKAGKDARKLDWNATWRNWIRRAAEDGRTRGPRSGPRSTSDERVAQVQALKQESARLELL